MQKCLFFKFSSAICLYYISYAVLMGYAALYMQSKGFHNTEIGVFFACSAVFCILMQIFSGSFLDRHINVSSKAFLVMSGVVVLVAASVLYFASHRYMVLLCYTVIGSFMLLNSSLFNSLGMEYINADTSLNYSLARGLGSFSYACASLVMGFVISRFSVMSIFPVFFLSHCAMLLFLVILKPADIRHYEKPQVNKQDNFAVFFRKNSGILFLLISILLVYISYTTINNFHINIIESVGGGSKELGISTSLSAMLELPAMALFVPLSRKTSYRNLLCISCAFFFIKIVLLVFARTVSFVYLSQCLQFFSYGLFIPSSAYFMNSVLPIQDKVKGQTALGIFTFGLGGLISSLLSGVLLDFFNVRVLMMVESVLTLFGVVGVVAACHRLARGR